MKKLLFTSLVLLTLVFNLHAQFLSAAGDYSSSKVFTGTAYNYSAYVSIIDVISTGGTTSASYGTLKAAFDAINAGTHQGDIQIKINNSTTETATATLNASGSGSANYTTVVIYPTVTGLNISGNLALPLIDLNGADNITIDGRVNRTGSTADLIISNTNTSAASGTSTIRFINDAVTDTVKYCYIKGAFTGAYTVTDGGGISFSTTTGTTGNDNNVIEYNNFTNAGSTPTRCVFSNGTSAKENSGNIIRNNNFYDIYNTAVGTYAVYVYNNSTDFVVSGNSFYETASVAPTGSGAYLAIRIANASGNNFTLNNNYVGGSAPQCGGSAFTKTSSNDNTFMGIFLQAGTTTASNIQGNTVKNINWSNSVFSMFQCIYVVSGSANIGDVTSNVIGSETGNGSITYSCNGSTNAKFYGIMINGSGYKLVTNNKIGSVTTANALTTAKTEFYGIVAAGSGSATISNNLIGSLTTANSIDLTSESTSTTQACYAISFETSGGGPYNVTGNTVANLMNRANNSNSSVRGINNAPSGAYAVNYNSNIFYNFSASSTATTPAMLIGIWSYGSTAYPKYTNNIIKLGGNTGAPIYGIYDVATTTYFYHNAVYIDGAPTSGSWPSYCLYSIYSYTRDYKNNILMNARSNNGGTGNHYSASITYNTGLTINNNDYYTTGTGGVLGNYGGADKTTLADWKAATGQDANSLNINPLFANAGGTSATDYKPGTTLPGAAGTGVLTDYLGLTRGSIPTMGAFELFPITVNSTSGTATANYSSVKQAMDAINAGTHQGTILIKINGNSTESATATLNASGTGSASYTSVKIYPTVSGLSITGSLALPLIDLNGADSVTIDGRVNMTGTTPDLTITNTSTSSTAGTSTIRFINDASQNVIKFCYLKGSSTAGTAPLTANGIVYFATGTATGNDNNTITNNNITNEGGYRPTKVIYSAGSASYENSGNVISNNNIYNIMFLSNISSYGSNGIYIGDYNTNFTISGNSIYETSSYTGIAGSTTSFIAIVVNNTTGTGHNITGNYIGGSAPQCGGTAFTKTGTTNNSFYGLIMGTGTTAASNVDGNVIKNFNWTNSGGSYFYGMRIYQGSVNIGTNSGNIIGGSSGNDSIVFTNGSSGGSFYGISIEGNNDKTVSNNKIGAIKTANTLTTAETNVFGIYSTYYTLNLTLSNNLIGSTTTANSINATSTSTTSVQNVYGIYLTQAGNKTLTGNTVSNLTNGTTSSTTTIYGSNTGIYLTNNVNNVTNNTVLNLKNSNVNNSASSTASVNGIVVSSGTAGQIISHNKIYNLSNDNAGFAGNLNGIFYSGGTSSEVAGNYIKNFSVNSSNTTSIFCGIQVIAGTNSIVNNLITLNGNYGSNIFGLYEVGGINSIYFNTIYIYGSTPSGVSKNSYCLYSSSANTRNYRNNIFVNNRLSSIVNACMYIYSLSNLTINYNDYYYETVSGYNQAVGMSSSNIYPTIAAFKGYTLQDGNSMNVSPLFASAGDTAATGYIPSTQLYAAGGTGILEDYQGGARSASLPEMGAFEITLPPLLTVTATGGTLTAGYSSLKGAIDAINAGTHQGVIEIKIGVSLTESASCVLNGSGTGSASYTSVNIYPTVTGLSITGNLSAPIIDLNGADNVTIDGRVNATGTAKDLIITNTSNVSTTGTSTIRMYNGANNNTIKYCNVKGSSTDASAGTIFLGGTAASTGNTIDKNNITNSADLNRPINSVYSGGAANTVTISNNNFYDFLSRISTSYGVNLNTSTGASTVSGNSFYETSTFSPTLNRAYYYPIYINSTVAGFTVSGNYIGGNAPLCTGTLTKTNSAYSNFGAINIYSVGTGTPSVVKGNVINNIVWNNNNNDNSWQYGIAVNSGDVTVGASGEPNTIGSITGTPNMSFTFDNNGSYIVPILLNGSGYITCQYNNIGGITCINSNLAQCIRFAGIYRGNSNVSGIISNNTIGSSTNPISLTSTSNNDNQYLTGIYNTGSAATELTISNNTISYLNNGATNTGYSYVSGILNYDSPAALTITNNTIHDLTISNVCGGGGRDASVRGGIWITTGYKLTVNNNTVYNLSNTYSTFNGYMYGIYAVGGSLVTNDCSGNTVYNITAPGTSAGPFIYGIYFGAGSASTNTVNRNYVYGLSSSGTTGNSWNTRYHGIYRQNSSNNLTIANNIISLGGNNMSTIYGIYNEGNATGYSTNLYFNTLYISGSPTAGGLNSTVMYNPGNDTRTYKNNIFYNARSNNGTTGNHYCLYHGSSTAAISNYNDIYAPGTGGYIGYYNGNYYTTMSAWRTGTSGDANSYNTDPLFLNAAGTNATDYKPGTALLGTGGTGITTDYIGTTRSTTSPVMGAWEVDVPPAAPVLVSPLSGSMDNLLSPTFVWNKSTGATGYNLVVSRNSNFTAIVYNDSTITDTSKTITGLQNGLYYFWKVRAKNSTGWGAFSTVFNFITMGAPSTVVLSSPSNNAVNQPNNLTFKWFKANDNVPMAGPDAITKYWYELATDSLFTSLTSRDSTLTDTTKAISGLINFTKYYWRVKAGNATGWGSFSSAWNFTTINALPTAPTLISPANGVTSQALNLNLVWNKPQYATGYNVILATDTGFTSVVLNDTTLTDSVKAITNLTPQTTYYWKVRAKSAAGWGAYSSAYNFKTVGTATQVVLSSPSNGVTGQPVSLTFKWFKAVDLTDGPDAILMTYCYELATDAGFTSIVTRDSVLTDTTKTVSGLSNITTYYWRVKAKNQAGWGSYSSVWNFTTIVPIPSAPTLVSPITATLGHPLSLNLIWNKSQYATGYNVVMATDASFTTVVLNDSTLTDTLKSLTNLTPQTIYYWKVRAKNAAGWGTFSGAYNFKTVGTATQVTLSSPSNGATGQPVNLTFKWLKATDLTASIQNSKLKNQNEELKDGPDAILMTYCYELATDAGFTNIVTRDTSLTDTTKAVSGLSNITTYYWRVKAKNQAGWGSFSTVWNFTTIVPSSGVPTLISPSYGSTGNPLNLNLVWSKPQYSTQYNVVLSTDTGFTSIVLNDTTLTDSVKSLTNLTPLTTYYWKVRAKNAAGWGSYSSAFNFKTVGSATQVILSTPTNGATNQAINLTFKWFKAIDQTDGPDAIANYWYELSTDAGFSTIVARDTLLTDTTKAVSGLNNITTYYWRVKAKNQVGWGAFSTVWNFTTIVPSSGVPVLLSPSFGSTGNPLNLNLVWSKPQYSTQYNVVLSTDTGFTSIVLNDTTLTDSVKSLTNLNALTTYFWKVRAKNASGWGSFSSASNFKTVGVPTQVVLSTPLNNATGQPLNLTFKWFKAVDQTLGLLTVSNYWIELATDAGFTTIVARDTTLTDTTASISGLSYITDYYWRVKAKSQIGWGGFSNSFKFTTIVPVSSAPALISPLNNSIGNFINLNLVWNKPQYASSYNVIVATDAGFTSIVLNDSTLTDSLKAITNLNGLTTYYWKVRAKNASGWSSFSSVYNFKTLGTPTKVLLYSPFNDATDQPVSLTFKWYKALDRTVMKSLKNGSREKGQTEEPQSIGNYWIELATDSSFASIIYKDTLVTDTTKNITGLSNNTMYYWRVKAKNETGWGAFSEMFKFRTVASYLTLNLKVYLEGFWDGTSQISDTTTVYLASSTTPYAFVDTAKVVLSTTGQASMNFTKVSTGSYYIVVSHRNHLETWSGTAQAFVGGTPLSYDFTTSSAQAFGDNMKQVGSVWVLYGGDANADGSIDAMDIGIFITEYGNLGYLRSDFNGDQDVNAADILIISQNFGSIKIIPGVEPLAPETKKNLKKDFDNQLKSGKDIKKIVSDKKNAVNDKKKPLNN